MIRRSSGIPAPRARALNLHDVYDQIWNDLELGARLTQGWAGSDVTDLGDPWEGVPADKRLDFAVIREPLEKLAAGTILNVERALPAEIAKVLGAPAVLPMLAKSVDTMSSAMRHLCGDKPQDSAP